MLNISTDHSRRVNAGLRTHAPLYDERISTTLVLSPFAGRKATNVMRLVANLNVSNTTNALPSNSTIPSAMGQTYIPGELARKTLDMILRFDIAMTPELTIQYYATSCVCVGRYSHVKKAAQPRAKHYEELCHVFDDDAIRYQTQENKYVISENGQTDYIIGNPEFNFREFRSNLVACWEFRPGSALYLVWTHGRSLYENVWSPFLNDALKTLFDSDPEHVYLFKFKYWLSI